MREVFIELMEIIKQKVHPSDEWDNSTIDEILKRAQAVLDKQ